MQFSLVELESGEQEYFDSPIQAFLFAQEHKVEYVAIGNFYEGEGVVYKGKCLQEVLASIASFQDWTQKQDG